MLWLSLFHHPGFQAMPGSTAQMRQPRPAAPPSTVRSAAAARPITGTQQPAPTGQRMPGVGVMPGQVRPNMPTAQPQRPSYKYTTAVRNPPTQATVPAQQVQQVDVKNVLSNL